MELIEMAKKNPTPKEPTVSNIPIPASENPMVIDLPDGQKIVLGKLSPGAVIEVATWRGTGRPDSRTNRLMMGISDPAAPQQVTAPQPNNSAEAKRKMSAPWKREKMNEAEKAQGNSSFISRFVGGTIASFTKALNRTKDLTPVESTTDLEINAWLENLTREVKDEVKAPAKKTSAARKSPASKGSVVSRSTTKKATSAKKKSK